MGRSRREGLRVLLDHLLNVLLQAHRHGLSDVHVQIDVDRLVGRLHVDAAGQRHRKRDSGRDLRRPFPWSGHLVPPGGGDWFVLSGCGAGRVLCSSVLLVLSTSTLSAGESIGNGMTGAMTCVGSLNDFAIWMIARNGPLMLMFSRIGIFEKTWWTSPATKPCAGPSDTPSIVSVVANSPARSPFNRTIIDRYRISRSRS